MSSCWHKESGSIVARRGYKLALERERKEVIKKEKERIRNLPPKPNKLTIGEMIFYFCLICKNMEDVIKNFIPIRDLAEIILPFLYPRKIFLKGFDINSNMALSSKYFRECTPYGEYIDCKFIPKHNFRKMWFKMKSIDCYSFCIHFFNNFDKYVNGYSPYDYCVDFNIKNLSLNKKWLEFLNIEYDIHDGINKIKISYLVSDYPSFEIFRNRIKFLLDIDGNKQTNKYIFKFINDPRNDFFKLKQVWNLCKIFYIYGYFN